MANGVMFVTNFGYAHAHTHTHIYIYIYISKFIPKEMYIENPK
jgi:hypothetical protein